MLRGNDRTIETIGNDCSPVKTYEDMINDDWLDLPEDIMKNKKLNELAYPCGYIAKYQFNDKIVRIESDDGKQSNSINDKNIGWFHDRNFKYKTIESRVDDYWTNVEDQHFMVWNTMTSLSDFRKLYG
jgi:hypothetical protein